MRQLVGMLAVVTTLVSCADAPTGPATGGTSASAPSPTTTEPTRVDLVEAGLRAVLPSDGGREVLYVMTKLCRTTFTEGRETCEGRLTDEEQAVLAERLAPLAEEIAFYPTYDDIPPGGAPIDHPSAVVAWVGPPEDRDNGTYWTEAGETCGGLCGHGGIYVLERQSDGWVSTGNAPGTGMWIS